MKIRHVEAELFHAVGQMEGQTDKHDEANGSFSQICESASKNFHHIMLPTSNDALARYQHNDSVLQG